MMDKKRYNVVVIWNEKDISEELTIYAKSKQRAYDKAIKILEKDFEPGARIKEIFDVSGQTIY